MSEFATTSGKLFAPTAAEALVRGLFDAPGIIAGAIEDIGDDYRYVIANRQACLNYGVPEGALAGKTGRDMNQTPAHIEQMLSLLRSRHEKGRAATLEYEWTPPAAAAGWFLGTYAPLPPSPGAGARMSFIIIDITARKEAELEAARQKERLTIALEATHLGLWEYDPVTGVLIWDARTRELYGVSADAPVDFQTYIGGVHPDDVAGQTAAYEAAIRGENGGAFVREHRTVAPNGRVRWVEAAARVIFANGQPVRVLGTIRDIDESVKALQRQALLLAELYHRVKNNLATVQSLAGHTLRSTPDPAAFREAFEARLMSLANAHDLLMQTAWETAEFAALIAKAIEPFPLTAFELRGPAEGVRVRPDFAVSLTLLIHELATNAAKYGALSQEGGKVTVTWRAEGGQMGLEWTETGGPPVSPPTRTGFGARQIRRSIQGIGGEADLEFHPAGLRARFTAPLAAGVNLDGE
jgi:PAS domain S-box-containing protein